MFTNEEIEREIRMYLSDSSESVEIEGYEDIAGESARLYTFVCGGSLRSFTVVYSDGTVFLPESLDAAKPKNKEDFCKINWITPYGNIGVIVDGLPRLFTF